MHSFYIFLIYNNGLVINKQTPFIYSEYSYDENDRLTQEETSINSLQTQVITSYEYNDNNQVVYITTEYLSVKTL